MGTSTPPPGFGGSDSGDQGPPYGDLPKYEGPSSDWGSPDARVPGPLGVFETIQIALALYGADAKKLWQIIAVVIIPIQVIVFILRTATVPSGAILQSSRLYLQPGTGDGAYVAVTELGLLVAVLALLFCVGAAYRILLGRHLNHPADLSTSFGFARERVLGLLWVSLLTGVFVAVGFVCLVIPGIYLFGCFAIAVPVLMAEDQRGFHALRRSRQLISQNWWHVFGAIIVAAIAAAVGEVVISVVADAITSGVAPHSVTGFLAINGIVSALVSILFYPFSAAVPVVLYVDMLVRKQDPQLDRLLA